jgi:hypothetical protein
MSFVAYVCFREESADSPLKNFLASIDHLLKEEAANLD